MRYTIEYKITGDNPSECTYTTDDPRDFIPRMRKEYGDRIKFKVRRVEE